MNTADILFWFLAGLIAVAVFGILLTKNVLHGALFLVVILLAISGVYVLLGSEYLAVVQLLVYAGGVVVLLGFGIMLISREDKHTKLVTTNQLVFPASIIVLTFFLFLSRVVAQFSSDSTKEVSVDQIKEFGVQFMSRHLLAFELIAVILLVVLVLLGLLLFVY